MDQVWLHLSEVLEWSKSIFAILGVAGISLAGVVAAAYTLFKWLGERWLNQKFEQQLESFRAEQDRELERLRYRINSVFDRTKRLNDREYEVLPDIWGKVVEARGWAASCLAAFQQYANVGQMSDADLDEFLTGTKFAEAQKREILNAPNKQVAYNRVYERYRYMDAMDAWQSAGLDLSKNGIFVLPHLRDDIHTMLDLIHAALIEYEVYRDVRPRSRTAAERLSSDGEQLYKKIQEAVAARLWEPVTAQV